MATYSPFLVAKRLADEYREVLTLELSRQMLTKLSLHGKRFCWL